MKYVIGTVGLALLFALGTGVWQLTTTSNAETPSFTEVELGFDSEPVYESGVDYTIGRGKGYTQSELREWQRPEGPIRVGIQVGHLDNQDMPEELEGLERNGTGAVAGPYNERDANEVIALLVAEELRADGVIVDLLPATIPPGYVADAFIAIHADGNNNTSVRGFKIAGPRRDYSGRSSALVDALYESYAEATNLPTDSAITGRMTAYYAFNWPRYEYAIHPFTPAAIVETGFLTNASDRTIIVHAPERSAAGIAAGIKSYLAMVQEPAPWPQTLVAPPLPLTGTLACATVRAERRNRDDGRCAPAITTQTAEYLLANVASTTLPAVGSLITVDGVYRPVQTLDNYFWFQYEVAGIIEVAEEQLLY